MNVIIRADSSLSIGTGHVTRCLTLAERLRTKGADVVFVCRSWPGDASSLIVSSGFRLCTLPAFSGVSSGRKDDYAAWLGVSQQQDARETVSVLKSLNCTVDWLVVDHYGIDAVWHRELRPHVGSLMVIDDLANRPLECDLLLDQNLSAQESAGRYVSRVPDHCTLLLGPEVALLRPEFGAGRRHVRPRDGQVRRMFVFYGGVDSPNMTTRALRAIRTIGVPNVDIDVVIGASNPHHKQVAQMCDLFPRATLASQVTDMAARMAQADLALGAGGTTTWERCCTGTPSLVVALADNQIAIGREAERLGVGVYLGYECDVTSEHVEARVRWALTHPAELRAMSERAMQTVDGHGADRVAQALIEKQARESVT